MRASHIIFALTLASLNLTAMSSSAYTEANEDIVATARILPVASKTEAAPLTPAPLSSLDASKAQFLAALDGGAQVERTLDDPIGYPAGPVTLNGDPYKRRIQTEVGVSIGAGGYRSGYIASLIPVGEHGTLGIAIGKTDFGRNSGYGLSPYSYDDYGYDPLGYEPIGYGYGHPGHKRGYGYGRRGGESHSLSLSYSVDARSRNRSPAEDNCGSGFYDGDRFVEPLWVNRVRGPRTCETTQSATPRN